MPLSLKILRAADNARKTLEAGVTSVRDAGGTPLGLKLAAERGLIPAPRMRIAVSILSQTGGHGDFLLPVGTHFPMGMPLDGSLPEWPNPVCDGVDEVRRTVRANLRAGADFIKLCSSGGVLSPSDEPTSTQFTREEIKVMVYEAAAEGKTCMAHAQSTEGIRNAVECGVESIEHRVYLDESVVEEMIRRGTFLVPTLLPGETLFDLAREKPGAVLPQSLRKAEQVFPHHRASFRMAVEAGVRIAMGTDSAVCPHGENGRELGLMVDNGMTEMEAIVASTKTAAGVHPHGRRRRHSRAGQAGRPAGSRRRPARRHPTLGGQREPRHDHAGRESLQGFHNHLAPPPAEPVSGVDRLVRSPATPCPCAKRLPYILDRHSERSL